MPFKDPERRREYYARWRQANLERCRTQEREYARAHADRKRAIVAKWQKENPERKRLNWQNWKKRHPEIDRANSKIKLSRRRARLLGNGGSHTIAEWIGLCWASAWRCAYCGRTLEEKQATQDHKIPLSRGGTNDIGNIAVACMPCNRKKRNMTDAEFERSRSLEGCA